jgi:hypothetical protein
MENKSVCLPNSYLNVFDDGAVLLRSVIWTLSIVLMFCNYNVSREEPFLETLWLQNIRTMDEVQIIDRSNVFTQFICVLCTTFIPQ